MSPRSSSLSSYKTVDSNSWGVFSAATVEEEAVLLEEKEEDKGDLVLAILHVLVAQTLSSLSQLENWSQWP